MRNLTFGKALQNLVQYLKRISFEIKIENKVTIYIMLYECSLLLLSRYYLLQFVLKLILSMSFRTCIYKLEVLRINNVHLQILAINLHMGTIFLSDTVYLVKKNSNDTA